MELSNTKKLNVYKAILPKVEADNMMPICILLGEYLEKKLDKQQEIWNKISMGLLFQEIKNELLIQKRDYYFKPETRVQFIKKQIQILKNKQ